MNGFRTYGKWIADMSLHIAAAIYSRFGVGCLITGIISSFALVESSAQELEPRRWSHLPIGARFGGAGYAWTTGDIFLDPVMQIENGELAMHSTVFKYVHSFEFFEKSARFDFIQGHHQAKWSGSLAGQPASTARTGLSDTVLRLSTNLIGAPPLEAGEFAAYRKSVRECETILGVALALHLPTGHYLEDRLLNLGSNRFTFRPQIGLVHNRGPWSLELTGTSWLFTENDDFYGGNSLELSPLFSGQGHLVYTFRPGLWLGGGIAYGSGAESTLNGIEKNDTKNNLLFGVNLGVPLTRNIGLKFGYIGNRTQTDIGISSDSFLSGLSFMW